MRIDMNIIYGIIIVVLGFLFAKYGAPYLKKNKLDVYTEVKLGLLLFGFAFRDDKINTIVNMAIKAVSGLEALSLASPDKHEEAVHIMSEALTRDLNIVLPREALDLIVRVAVTVLPQTNQA